MKFLFQMRHEPYLYRRCYRANYFLAKKGKKNNVYNIGQKKEIKISKLIEMISKLLNVKIIIKEEILKGSTLRKCRI